MFHCLDNRLDLAKLDRVPSTFLLQFCGSKQMAIFPPWEERAVCARGMEGGSS